MPMPGMFCDIFEMDTENFMPLEVSKAKKNKQCKCTECILTSEKIRHVLKKFPAAQPIPSNVLLIPKYGYGDNVCTKCIASNCRPVPQFPTNKLELEIGTVYAGPGNSSDRTQSASKGRAWSLVGEVVHLLQLMVVATALGLYYVIYGWMQFIYTALQLALFFHQADKPMKITIGVVAVTSLVVGLNVLLRIWKLCTSIYL